MRRMILQNVVLQIIQKIKQTRNKPKFSEIVQHIREKFLIDKQQANYSERLRCVFIQIFSKPIDVVKRQQIKRYDELSLSLAKLQMEQAYLF